MKSGSWRAVVGCIGGVVVVVEVVVMGAGYSGLWFGGSA